METVTPGTTLRIHQDVVWRDVDGEIVLLNVTSGQYFGLDGSASRIWQLLGSTGTSVAVLCDTLAAEYDVDRATVDADVAALVDGLVSNQLVSVQS